mmetsp:Transcript_123012/g.330454  ORF Transcript_123012/g.330454 Transcript_123012/m.330454 type:complete len:273 (-) Transcript_123012:47-865(-)
MPGARPLDDGPVPAFLARDDARDQSLVACLVELLPVRPVARAWLHLDEVADLELSEELGRLHRLVAHSPVWPQLVLLHLVVVLSGRLAPAGGDAQCGCCCELPSGGVAPLEDAGDVELPDSIVGSQVDVPIVVDEGAADRDGVVDAARVVPAPGDVVREVRRAGVSLSLAVGRVGPEELAVGPRGPLGRAERVAVVLSDASSVHHTQAGLPVQLLIHAEDGLAGGPGLDTEGRDCQQLRQSHKAGARCGHGARGVPASALRCGGNACGVRTE